MLLLFLFMAQWTLPPKPKLTGRARLLRWVEEATGLYS